MTQTFKVVHIQTKASAQVVIRNRAGKKLFDIDVAGVSITMSCAADAEIKIEHDMGTLKQMLLDMAKSFQELSPEKQAEVRRAWQEQREGKQPQSQPVSKPAQ